MQRKIGETADDVPACTCETTDDAPPIVEMKQPTKRCTVQAKQPTIRRLVHVKQPAMHRLIADNVHSKCEIVDHSVTELVKQPTVAIQYM